MFFFFLDGRDVCDILESHCSFTIFTQFNWFIGKKEYVQKKQVTRIEKKIIYNRQTSRDNTYHERWHIWHIAGALYRSHSLVQAFQEISQSGSKILKQRFQRDARDRDNRSSAKILRVQQHREKDQKAPDFSKA